MLKMNKIYDWNVIPYTYDQIVNHTTMPSKVKLDIAKIWGDECQPRGYTTSGYTADGQWPVPVITVTILMFTFLGQYRPCPWLNMAWLHCDGENYADMENIGPV